MRIKPEEQKTLGEALTALGCGDTAHFLDMMWLGFGDRWTEIVDAMAEAKYVIVPDEDAYDGSRITERGGALAEQLTGRLAKSA